MALSTKTENQPLVECSELKGGASDKEEEEILASAVAELETIKGDLQSPAFRDWQFSVLFWAQVAAIAATALALAPAMFAGASSTSDSDAPHEQQDDFVKTENVVKTEQDTFSSWNMLLFVVGSFVAGSLVVMSAFRIMVHHPLEVIRVSFFVAPLTFSAVAILLWMAGTGTADANIMPFFFWCFAAVVSAISLCYYVCYKRFMPFAAINLKVALTAVRVNMGLFFLSLAALVAIYAWSILWILAFAGVLYHDQQKPQVSCQEQDPSGQYLEGQMCDQQPSLFAIIMLLLCFYWTQQVIQNTVHTTTAGTVSSWWISSTQLEPEDEIVRSNGGGSCCGPDVSSALYRSCTYSFGSICFGSLLVAILQTLEQLAQSRRGKHDLVSLVVQCLVYLIRAWLEYFNSWAFCYVGIYGYDYITAGRKVIELFKARGWTTLITDRLVFRVLLMAHLGTAAVTGALCVLLILSIGHFGDRQARANAAATGFWVGFFVGLMISSIVLFVVESAVRTIMVCFAEQPSEGPAHLLHELKETYAATYPDVFVFAREESMELRERRNVV